MGDELMSEGVAWEELASLAGRAQLSLDRWTPHPVVDDPHDIWIARGRMMFNEHDRDDIFPDPPRKGVDSHYVLARATTSGEIEIADPHPWHVANRRLGLGDFSRFCTSGARVRRRLPA